MGSSPDNEHFIWEKVFEILEQLPYTVTSIQPAGQGSTLVLRPNKKINMFSVTGLKILGRVGTYNFF